MPVVVQWSAPMDRSTKLCLTPMASARTHPIPSSSTRKRTSNSLLLLTYTGNALLWLRWMRRRLAVGSPACCVRVPLLSFLISLASFFSISLVGENSLRLWCRITIRKPENPETIHHFLLTSPPWIVYFSYVTFGSYYKTPKHTD